MKRYIILLVFLLLISCSCEKKQTVGKSPDTNPISSETDAITSEKNENDTIYIPESKSETDLVTSVPENESESEKDTTSPPPIEVTTPKEMLVTINEVCASNNGSFIGLSGETPDWIELYNSSDKAINLAGYGVSDDAENPFKYTFSNYLIEAKSYVILMASGNVGYNKGVISLPFKISSDGETLVLTSPERLSDVLVVPVLKEDETYGRITDGEKLVAHLTPTPLSTNNTAISVIKAPTPSFSHESGFYGSSFELEISIPENCVVYYTTDGSTPTAESEIYGEPILLEDATNKPNALSAIGGINPGGFVTKNNQDKANVIRAIAIDRDGNISDVAGATYFVMDEERAAPYSNMPIVSVHIDAHHLFDYETGIYVLGRIYDDYMNGDSFDPDKPTWSRPANYYMQGIESERPASIEYFDAEHNLCFAQNAGLRIGGNTSRSGVQKSFKFYARSEYGKSSFDYPLFGGETVYDTFLLRTGANDMAKSKIRDVLAQTLAGGRDFATAKWQPCVLFINGEYWGFYMMMERYDSDYFKDNYGVEKDEIVVIKTGNVDIGNEDDKALYKELTSFCKKNDLTITENYEKLCSMIDIQSYIDYVCMNVIINNTDWPGNNTSLWRTRSIDPENPYADGRWRWASYDTERSMLLYGESNKESFDNNTYERLINNGAIFKYVYKNVDFKTRFLQTLADMLMYDFARDRIESYLICFEENFTEQMELNRERYNTTKDYGKEIDVIRKFWDNRTPYLLKYTAQTFGLQSSALSELIVKTNLEEGGNILLGDYKLSLIDGRYIAHTFETPIILMAEAKEGYSFLHWAMNDGTIKTTDASIEISVRDADSITAIFEKTND